MYSTNNKASHRAGDSNIRVIYAAALAALEPAARKQQAPMVLCRFVLPYSMYFVRYLHHRRGHSVPDASTIYDSIPHSSTHAVGKKKKFQVAETDSAYS